MAAHSHSERVLVSKLAAHKRWAKATPEERAANVAAATKAAFDRFEKQVDPDGVLDPAERAKRAEHARSAYYAELALRSVQARTKRAQRARQAKAARAALADATDAA